jgi:hypothetical protein
MRSPLGSEESGVAWPRVVVGEAAQMASVVVQWGVHVKLVGDAPYLRRGTWRAYAAGNAGGRMARMKTQWTVYFTRLQGGGLCFVTACVPTFQASTRREQRGRWGACRSCPAHTHHSPFTIHHSPFPFCLCAQAAVIFATYDGAFKRLSLREWRSRVSDNAIEDAAIDAVSTLSVLLKPEQASCQVPAR